MVNDAARRPAGLSPEADQLLSQVARKLGGRGLAAPVIMTLECLRPAAFLGGQAMRMLTPFVELASSGDDWRRLAQILEVRGSVERLIAHLEALPGSLLQAEAVVVPPDAAFVIVDCGSTTTKAVLIAQREGRYRLAGRAEAPTTVEAPVEDVTVGVWRALRLLHERTGHAIVGPGAEGLEPPRNAGHGVGALLATSSAGGGLQMAVMGLVRTMTTASAERAALGAGAIVTDTVAWSDLESAAACIERLRRVQPDMVLLAGGTDGGAVAQVVALAELLAAADLRPRWGGGPLPVVFAGNRDAVPGVTDALAGRADLVLVANLRPDLDHEDLGPVRLALQDVFLSHVMARAPGYPTLQEACHASVLPTPVGFGESLEMLATDRGGDVVAIDLGGATCDVFSVHQGEVFRSVSANLGLSFSLGAVCGRAGWSQVARWLPLTLVADDLRDRVRNKQIRPTTLPQTPEDLLLEQAAAREAIRLALLDHAQALQPLRSGRDGPSGLDALRPATVPEEGVRWRDVSLIVGSGGALAHAPLREQAAAILLDACRPSGITELAVDSVFIMPHLGVLRRYRADAARSVLEADAIVMLGVAVAPVDRRRPEPGATLARIRVRSEGDDGPGTEATLVGGELARLPLADGCSGLLDVTPQGGWDFGGGPNQSVAATVRGGPAGIILDGRGHDLGWPRSAASAPELVAGWLRALGALPPGWTP